MKKYLIALALIGLSACYHTAPTADYYFDDGYYEPDYYSQTTYIAPSTSYFFASEQRTYYEPDIIYINENQPHHHAPHRYHYPPHHHKNMHRDRLPEGRGPSSIIPKSRHPNHGRNEKVIELPNNLHSHDSHHGSHRDHGKK